MQIRLRIRSIGFYFIWSVYGPDFNTRSYWHGIKMGIGKPEAEGMMSRYNFSIITDIITQEYLEEAY